MFNGGGHVGTFLLFAAFALLLVSTISSPVFRQISFLDIYQGNARSTFGVFGYCINAACTPRQLGYNISALTSSYGGNEYVNDSLNGLTRALVLHPIATGLAFIAFLIAAFSDRIGFLFASFVSLLAFIVSLVAMAIDFAIFTVVRNRINNLNVQNISASYSNAIWLTLAATVLLFFSTFIVCFSCCTARRRDRHAAGINNRY